MPPAAAASEYSGAACCATARPAACGVGFWPGVGPVEDQSAFLDLEFRSGAIYRYLEVPARTYRELLRAESKGGYFNQHLRNRFAYSKIDPARTGATRDSAANQGTSNLPG